MESSRGEAEFSCPLPPGQIWRSEVMDIGYSRSKGCNRQKRRGAAPAGPTMALDRNHSKEESAQSQHVIADTPPRCTRKTGAKDELLLLADCTEPPTRPRRFRVHAGSSVFLGSRQKRLEAPVPCGTSRPFDNGERPTHTRSKGQERELRGHTAGD